MMKTSDLRQREVIILQTQGGFVADLDIDLEKGVIKSIIIRIKQGF